MILDTFYVKVFCNVTLLFYVKVNLSQFSDKSKYRNPESKKN